MNKLQLVNDFIIESGIDDEIGSTIGQTGELAQAVKWVEDAWLVIQRSRRWAYRWAEGSFNTVADQSIHTLSDQGRVIGDEVIIGSFWATSPTTGQRYQLQPTDFSAMKVLRGSASTGAPRRISILPDKTIEFSPTPDGIYALDFEYFATPSLLTADLDVPELQEEFHKAIVWKALEQYAREQGKEWTGLYQAAIRNYNAIFSQMLDSFTSEFKKGDSPYR